MNTARFSQFHDVWGNKWSFCSEEKETGTTILSLILYWVPLPYEIDTGTLCLLQTRLFHSARWSGWNHLLVTLRLVCSTIMVKFYEKWWITEKKSQITDISNFCYWLHQKGIGIYDNTVSSTLLYCVEHAVVISCIAFYVFHSFVPLKILLGKSCTKIL